MNESIEQWNAKVVPRNTRRQRSSGDRKPGGAKPFKRAAKLYMEALELRQKYANNLSMLQMLINGLPAYISRGHGHRKGYSASRENFYPRPSKYKPHQGKSECARRCPAPMPSTRACSCSNEAPFATGYRATS